MRVGAFAGALGIAAVVGAVVSGNGGRLDLTAGGDPLVVTPSDPVAGSQEVGFRFLRTRTDATPVRWNPCEPIHYEVNLELAPQDALDDVHEAVARLEQATGLRFVYDGETDERGSERLDGEIAELAPDGSARYEPVLIAWADDVEMARLVGDLEPDIMGAARPVARKGVYVTGVVLMRSSLATTTGFGFFGAGPVLQHEWGHVAGLDHVADSNQMMAERVLRLDWGKGDLQGLAKLGRAEGCLAVPDPAEVLPGS